MIHVGVIGYGYWGPNVARNLAAAGLQVAAIADLSAMHRHKAALAFPGARIAECAEDIIDAPAIDAVVIATPVASHYELAMASLRAGKHVLIEKPMAASAEQCKRLVDLAATKQRTLMVDHTFVYTGAIRKIAEVLRDGEVGDPIYYDSVRINLGIVQSEVNVLWDLAVHDISIVHTLLKQRAEGVSAVGMKHIPGQPESIAYLTLHYGSSLLVHIHVNWLSPVKIRRTLIGCTKRMIVYDDLEPSEKVKIYDCGVDVRESIRPPHELRVGYRAGDMWAPRIDVGEALKTEMIHFRECLETGRTPITDGLDGLQAVEVLEGATQSMHDGGRVVRLR